MTIKPLDIFAGFNKARFTQAGSADCANWYAVNIDQGKGKIAYYPAMGRRHITLNDDVKLVFDAEPRATFRSKNYFYVVISTRLYQVDRFYQQKLLSSEFATTNEIWFDYFPVGDIYYCMFTDGFNVFVVTENADGTSTTQKCTDTNRPTKPTYVTAFGNRFVVSELNSSQWTISTIDLDGTASTWFTTNGSSASIVNASGVVGQLATLHNQLYIFTDETVEVWADIPTQITLAGGGVLSFPFKKNTAYNWDIGIENDRSLSVDFGMMVWLGKNKSGLVTFVMSNGGQPVPISNDAVNVLLESTNQDNGLSPFISYDSQGFLYQWENNIFYRVSAGKILATGEVDLQDTANAIEYNFNQKRWSRVIELDGERNKIDRHVYFNHKHLVTVKGMSAIMEMRGDLYYNENQTAISAETFEKVPMRYELTTGQIFVEDYSEFRTDYVEIDFVFGDRTYYKNNTPFDNAVFIVDEDGKFIVTEDSESGSETFVIQDGTNTPEFDDNHYWQLFAPHIELYISDDGGVTFNSADLREFSQIGQYQYKMRWYQLGVSRNRVYKLVCVSKAPIVILGAVQNVTRVSGGAN